MSTACQTSNGEIIHTERRGGGEDFVRGGVRKEGCRMFLKKIWCMHGGKGGRVFSQGGRNGSFYSLRRRISGWPWGGRWGRGKETEKRGNFKKSASLFLGYLLFFALGGIHGVGKGKGGSFEEPYHFLEGYQSRNGP